MHGNHNGRPRRRKEGHAARAARHEDVRTGDALAQGRARALESFEGFAQGKPDALLDLFLVRSDRVHPGIAEKGVARVEKDGRPGRIAALKGGTTDGPIAPYP